MPTIDERVTSLEARVDAMSDLRNLITDLRSDTNRQFVELRGDMNRQLTDLRGDTNRQFAEFREDVRGQFGAVDRRFSEVGSEMRLLRQDIDHRFAWLVGIVVTGFVATVGAIGGVFWGLLQIVRG